MFRLVCFVLLLLRQPQLCPAASAPAVSSTDANALLAFKAQLGPSSASNLSSWDVSTSPCSWSGVSCNASRVVALNLTARNLSGLLSAQLADLPYLTYLNLSSNNLSGEIPPQLSRLPFLTHLDLHNNNLTGEIPPELSLCSSLSVLDLSWNPLSGTIPPSLGSLGNLRMLQLHHIANLSGAIPVQLSRLSNLTHLCLGHNNLTGIIPPEIGNLSNLVDFACYENSRMVGSIPSEIGQLLSLRSLKLFNLNLSGSSIPPELGNLSSLQYLYLFNAALSGPIPQELGKLSNLSVLALYQNQFSGTIPSSLGQLRNLTELYIFASNLTGGIPPQLGNLSKLQFLNLYNNNLSGSIPPEIGNLSGLQSLSIHFNKLTGQLPAELGQLSNLREFYASANNFHGPLPPQLGQLKRLIAIGLGGNQFAGSIIPQEFGAMESLQSLEMSDVQVIGEIPSTLGNLKNLTFLRLSNNKLNGSLPPSLAKCSMLQWLKLENNFLTGEIPPQYYTSFSHLHTLSLHRNKLTGQAPEKMASLATLVVLDLGYNKFSGKVPDSWSDLHNLSVLSLASNRFEGDLPPWIWNLTQLQLLDLSNNAFTGTISPKINQLNGFKEKQDQNGKSPVGSETLWNDDVTITDKGAERSYFTNVLTIMASLDLSRNKLQGQIPGELGELTAIFNLNLSGNALEGSIPSSFGDLDQLESLDLSYNHLCGEIPMHLTALSSLGFFNVSYNFLSGSIPQGGQFPFAYSSYLGNFNLCGLPLTRQCNGSEANSCYVVYSGSHHTQKWKITYTIAACFASIAVAIYVSGAICLICRNSMHNEEAGGLYLMDKHLREVKQELLQLILQGCNEGNLVGVGGFSDVHKLTLSNGKVVAVKKLRLDLINEKEAKLSFLRESKTLGRVRHRNVLKLLGIYSSPTNHHNLACIFDFVSNGTLDEHLHKSKEDRPLLDWDQRLKIAIGVAQGLTYLHNESGFGQILHLDLKPSNILLDDDLQPHISDFGISRMMERNQVSATLTHFRGTIGYAAPECAYSQVVSDRADVYSFGIVLLEMLTGRRPCDGGFHGEDGSLDLRAWVVAHWTSPAPDSSIWSIKALQQLSHMSSLQDMSTRKQQQQQVQDALRVALLCTQQQPSSRPSVKQALDMLLLDRCKSSPCNHVNSTEITISSSSCRYLDDHSNMPFSSLNAAAAASSSSLESPLISLLTGTSDSSHYAKISSKEPQSL